MVSVFTKMSKLLLVLFRCGVQANQKAMSLSLLSNNWSCFPVYAMMQAKCYMHEPKCPVKSVLHAAKKSQGIQWQSAVIHHKVNLNFSNQRPKSKSKPLVSWK